MQILKEAKRYTIQVLVKGSNIGKDGNRQNTMRSFTVIDSTVDEVAEVVKVALEKESIK